MTTRDATDVPADDTATTEPSARAASPSFKPVVLLWVVAAGFGVLTYVGVTNDDVSPTIMGELLFGFIAVVLFLAGLVALLKRL